MFCFLNKKQIRITAVQTFKNCLLKRGIIFECFPIDFFTLNLFFPPIKMIRMFQTFTSSSRRGSRLDDPDVHESVVDGLRPHLQDVVQRSVAFLEQAVR